MTETADLNLLSADNYITSDYIDRELKEATDILSGCENLNDLSYAQVSKALYDCEKLDLALRRNLLSRTAPLDIAQKKELSNGTERELKVTFEVKDGLIRVHIPNTIVRYKSESWYISNRLSYLMDAWKKENGDLLSVVECPVFLIVKRKVPPALWGQRYRDNDNFEMTKVVNTIFERLNSSDGPFNMAYTSKVCRVLSEKDAGTEIVIFSEKDFDKYGNEFVVY